MWPSHADNLVTSPPSASSKLAAHCWTGEGHRSVPQQVDELGRHPIIGYTCSGIVDEHRPSPYVAARGD